MNDPSRTTVEQYAHDVIGAAIAIHRDPGPGYLESVYEEALNIEFDLCGIPYSRQHPISVTYKGHTVGENRLDFLIGDCLIVELKAVESFLPIHRAQIISYLKATNLTLGLLINFNVEMLKQGIKRIILT